MILLIVSFTFHIFIHVYFLVFLPSMLKESSPILVFLYLFFFNLQMPDAVVDYDLSNGKWNIIQQQNMLHERTRILYGTALSSAIAEKSTNVKFSSMNDVKSQDENLWNDLSEFYACEHHDVSSHDGAVVPLTIVYSRKNRKDNQSPGLLHGHGAYGEILDKRWRSELKSLLDRGWIVAYADVRFVFHTIVIVLLAIATFIFLYHYLVSTTLLNGCLFFVDNT